MRVLDYAILALAENDPLGFYVFAKIKADYQQKHDPFFENTFKAKIDSGNVHHQFVTILFAHVRASKAQTQLAVQNFLQNQVHPIAAFF